MTTATDTASPPTPSAPPAPSATASPVAASARVRRKEWWIVGTAGMVLVGSLAYRIWASDVSAPESEPTEPEATTEVVPTINPPTAAVIPATPDVPTQDRREVPALAAADVLFRERRFDDARRAYAAFLLAPVVPSGDPAEHLAWARARHALCLGRQAAATLGDLRLPEPAFRFDGAAR